MKKLMLLAVLMAFMCSCNSNKFKVTGVVEGAGDTTMLYLETSENGRWYVVDSVKTDNDKFSFSEDAIEYPNVYRLVHGTDAIYFPIDSIDKIEIKTTIKDFAFDYTLSGSNDAERMMMLDKQLAKFVRAGDTSSDAFKKWKEEASRDIVANLQSIVSYYMINKYIGNQPLFNPEDNKDFKIIGAVVNSFYNFRPNDPRTKYLTETFKDKLRQRSMANNTGSDTIFVAQTGVLDIKLMDKDGKMQSFKDVCSKGNVVILNFTLQSQSFSPAINKLLNDMYHKYKSKGLEIFQVSFDDNEATWMQAVSRLPWIVMRDPDGAATAVKYNIYELPTIYIINRSGDIAEKVENIQLLEDSLLKYI